MRVELDCSDAVGNSGSKNNQNITSAMHAFEKAPVQVDLQLLVLVHSDKYI